MLSFLLRTDGAILAVLAIIAAFQGAWLFALVVLGVGLLMWLSAALVRRRWEL